MYCKNCGNQLIENSKFCGKCGHSILDTALNTESSINKESTPEKVKIINHVKRIRNWSIFYITLSIINIALYFYISIETESSIFIAVAIPALIMGLLAIAMLYYKNNLTVRIFFFYYISIFIIIMAIGSATGNTDSASLLFWFGLIGIFQCWNSASAISKID